MKKDYGTIAYQMTDSANQSPTAISSATPTCWVVPSQEIYADNNSNKNYELAKNLAKRASRDFGLEKEDCCEDKIPSSFARSDLRGSNYLKSEEKEECCSRSYVCDIHGDVENSYITFSIGNGQRIVFCAKCYVDFLRKHIPELKLNRDGEI